MSTLVGIDPGVNACGVALFAQGTLETCGLCPVDEIDCHWQDRVIIECPQAYRASLSKGDPNDLIDLARVVGRLEERANGRAEIVKPRTWKGQVPKEVMIERIKSLLAPDELARVPKMAKSKLHNVYDSIGLALWALGRLKQKP